MIYNTDDRCIEAVYPDGGIQRTWYDANGNIIKIVQPEAYDQITDDGPGYEYAYDKANRLIEIKGPDGHVQKRFVYNLKGHLVKEIDAKGYLMGQNDESRIGTLYTYNLLGWMTEKRVPVKEENGTILYAVTQYSYSKAGDLIKEKRYADYQTEQTARGSVHTIQYTYNKNRHLVKVTDSTGAVVEYRYDALGQRIYEKRKINEKAAEIINYKYDGRGNLIEETRSADQKGTGRRFVTRKYTYDARGNLVKIISPKGYTIERRYDAAGRMIQEEHFEKASGIANHITLQYDKTGNVVAITDYAGNQMLYHYDLMNQEIIRTNPIGASHRTLYNKNGQIIKQISPNQYAKAQDEGKGLTYSYDLCGRIVEVRNAENEIVEWNTYDLAGQLLERKDSLQQGVHYTYDLGGRTERIETTGGSSQCYRYDARGHIIEVVDGNGHQTRYQLDQWGRIVTIKKADESKETYTYDYAGNITTTTDANSHTITYTFNAINKLAQIIDQEGNEENFAYDAEGYLCESTDRNGNHLQYSYNMYGSLMRQREAKTGLSTSYQYYPDGKLKTAIAEGMRYDYTYYPNHLLKEKKASGKILLAYGYDLNDNKISRTDVTGKVTKYSYNILDQLTEIVDNGVKLASYQYRPDGQVKQFNQLNGIETTYHYDSNKNLAALEVNLQGKKIVENGYTYDGNGNRLEKNQLQGKTSYYYDALNRVTKVQYPNYTETFYYDPVGNRSKRITSGPQSEREDLYSYDVRNRLISLTTQTATDTTTIHYQYDQQGNLLSDSKSTYSYDGFNRTQKVETFDGRMQINHYDAEGLRHEIEENGQIVQFIFSGKEVVVEQTETDTIRLIRGYNMTASESERARTYYHYVSDEQGSTTHIFEGQDLCNYYEYDAFGNITTRKEQVHNRFKYTGQQYDSLTQQYYLRARYYNPIIARFTQEDTYRGDGLNLYAYCANNPIIYYDPSGYTRKFKCGIVSNDTQNALTASKNSEATADEANATLQNDKHSNTSNVQANASESGLKSIDNTAIIHSSVGDFTYNPKTGAVSKMKGGGHGQANIEVLETNGLEYNIVKVYDNGVRIGNIPDHKVKAKRTGTNQSWFPESWSESDIANAGAYIGNLPENVNVADGVTVFGNYNGVRVGVIRTNGRISTIFPDATSQP